MESKTCTKCGETKDKDCFAKTKYGQYNRHSQCKACLAAYARKLRAENPGMAAAVTAKYIAKNPEKARETALKSRAKRAQKHREESIEYHWANRERILERMRAFAKANRGKCNASGALRKARRLQATPVWADNKAILLIYTKAKRISAWLDVKHHVDHIVPLVSKFVCGLHCEANMQILTAVENSSKKNRYWPDMWEQGEQ